MILIYIFIYIPAAFLLYVVLKGIFSKDAPVTPSPRPKHRRKPNKSLPPLTAWTWWMYADKNSGRFPDAEWNRQYSRRSKRK